MMSISLATPWRELNAYIILYGCYEIRHYQLSCHSVSLLGLRVDKLMIQKLMMVC